MASNRVSEVIQHIRSIVLRSDSAGMTDGQLLSRYIDGRDGDAFAALVKRHAPMVWGVCRRLLPSYQDAEDAFQATFLVLVRKAAGVVPRELVANWLYGVAYMTAHRAQVEAAKRYRREKQVKEMPESAVNEPEMWADLRPLLDQELSRLPDKYRAIIMLCDLEGNTRQQVARQLGLPEGTVASRLARARSMLAKRLAAHGFALSGGALAAVLSGNAASAGAPPSLVSSTIKATSLFAAAQAAATGVISVKVIALTEGVLKTMLFTKLTSAVAAFLVVLVMAVGAAAVISRTLVAQPPKNENVKQAEQVPAREKTQSREILVLQKRIQSAARDALPAIVSFVGASGVIVSPEGLILTQAHVVGKDAKVGQKFWPILHNDKDTAAEAELLGADYVHDLAVLRLVKPGRYPFIPIADRKPVAGEGLLKLGYPAPLGYRKGRPPEVRFGKVLATAAYTFLVDCRINGGDSGGPFVDLDGCLVGILKASTPLADEGLPAGFLNLVMPRGSLWWTATASTMIRTRLARMKNGEIIQATKDELAQVPATRPFRTVDLIAEERRTQGKDALGQFRSAVADVRRSVVQILDGDEPVALGAVVDATGLILTKASEVPEEAPCRLPDGRVTAARVVGLHPAYDLALLRVPRVPAAGLVPVNWAKAVDLPAGTLLAAAGTEELPVAVGVVSIPRRDTPGPHPLAPSRYQRNKAAGPPALTGNTVPDVGYRVETSEGNAAAAGIRPGDVILTIAGSPVPDNREIRRNFGKNPYYEARYTFRSILEGRKAGERVPVWLLRGNEQIQVSLELGKVPDPQIGSEFVSDHADPPPRVITADMPVLPHECGAPTLGMDGTVVGMVISRFGVPGSFIIPADQIAALIADLKSGKPLSGFPARRPQPEGK